MFRFQNILTISIALFVVHGMVQTTFAQESSDQWNKFQNGGALEFSNWNGPTEWSPEQGILWEIELPGYGQSTPLIYEASVYVTSVVGDMKEQVAVRSFDVETGKLKWEHLEKNGTPQKNTVMISRAAPTPVVDKNGLIAFFEGGKLVALDHQGKLRWSKDLSKEYGDVEARHGLASSLEQNKSHVFVWVERMKDPYLVAIAKNDGSLTWKQAGLGSTSWGSPRLLRVENESHLVLCGSTLLAGYEPTTGKRLWEFKEISGTTSTTPVPVSNGKLLIGSMGSRSGGNSTPSCGLISVEKSGSDYIAKWEWSVPRLQCSFGSPIACNGNAYFVSRSGVLHCHNLKNGKVVYTQRVPCGQIWATPLATTNAIYLFGKNGITAVIDRENEYKLIAKNQLWKAEQEPSADNQMSSGAVLYATTTAGNRLIVRRGDRLYAIGK